MKRAAKSVKGQRPWLKASTAHSSRTRPVETNTFRKCLWAAATGMATMQPAKKSQIAVWMSLIAISASGFSDLGSTAVPVYAVRLV